VRGEGENSFGCDTARLKVLCGAETEFLTVFRKAGAQLLAG
jgi:hypothetical protein